MQGNEVKSFVGATDGFDREMEKKYSFCKQRLKYLFTELRLFLARLGEEQSY